MKIVDSISLLALCVFCTSGIAVAQSTTSTSTPATVTCKDGSTSKGGRGACSGHGGVNKAAASTATPASPAATPAAAPAAAAPAAPPTAAAPPPAAKSTSSTSTSTASKSGKSVNTDPTGAIAKCKDGTYSHAKTHTGACSHHGGVASFLDGH